MVELMDSPFDGRGARPADPVRAPILAPAPMVAWHRDAAGVLTSVSLTLDAACIEIADDDLDRLLRDARERSTADPHDDVLPPDWAVIEAAMEGW